MLLSACKDKQEQKPAPAPAPVPVAETKKEEPAPPPVVPPSQAAPIKPAGGFNTTAEYEARAFEMIDKLTDVFATSGTNCDKLAVNIETFLDKNKDALAAADSFEVANPGAEDDLEMKLQDKAKVFMQKVSISMQACQKHEGVKAALAKLPD
jgi:hypothetical protein